MDDKDLNYEISYHFYRANTKNTINTEINSVKKKIQKAYPLFFTEIKRKIANSHLSPFECERLTDRIIDAQLHFIFNYCKKLDEKARLNKIKCLINDNLDAYLYSYHAGAGLNNYIFEPQFALNFYYINTAHDTLIDLVEKTEDDTEKCLFLALIACSRALRASLLMFGNSDDVHGITTYRGLSELAVRLMSINEENISDWYTFIQWNRELQTSKLSGGKPIHSEELINLRKKERNLENYLLYSWITKDRNIKSFSAAVKRLNIPDETKERYTEFYRLASKFVHENYIQIPYNFIFYRREYIMSLCGISCLLGEIITGLSDNIPSKLKKLQARLNKFNFLADENR